MPILLGVREELEALITATWPDVTLTFGSWQSARMNWRDMVSSGSVVPPYCVIQVGEYVPDTDWGLDNDTSRFLVYIWRIEQAARYVSTLTQTHAASTTITPTSNVGCYVGQRVQVLTSTGTSVGKRTITMVVSPGNDIIVNSPITSTSGGRVIGEAETDIEYRLEKMRTALVAAHTTFQVMDDTPVIDATDSNAANAWFFDNSLDMVGGCVSANLLVGTSP